VREPYVGIDLGTTFSAIAWVDDSGRPVVLPNAEGGRTTPSVVQLHPDGSAVVGEEAWRELVLQSDQTARFFKRDMGRGAVYEYHGRSYRPADLSGFVLAKLRRDAEVALGRPVRKAVVTVPAYFDNGPRLDTQEAGRQAGLELLDIINEPTAAALAYGKRREETVLVYDLGGGTFDVSLVAISPDSVQVIGTDGDHKLGGKDWDDRLVGYLAAEFQRRHGADPSLDLEAWQELVIQAEDAKRALSTRQRVSVPILCEGIRDRIEVTREVFEDLTRDLISRTELIMSRLIAETGWDYGRVDQFLLVGGSTRMPMCGELVRRMTGREANRTVNPDECVAQGAALSAASYAPESQRPSSTGLLFRREQFRDVTSHSLGMIAVDAAGTQYVNTILIPKNQPIPSRQSRPYQTKTAPGRANTVSVFVTQGESDAPADCSYVGRYTIRDIPHVAGGDAVVDITYEYDRSGVVAVAAQERSTGRSLTVVKEPVPDDMSWVLRSPQERARVHKHVFLAIDLSGSMSGSPLANAKSAVRRFVEESDLSSTSIGLISFSDDAILESPLTQNARELIATAERWDTIGGTSAHPFDVAREQLPADGPRYVVALTDGQWFHQEVTAAGARTCKERGIEVIAIGFGDADEAFLRRIATCEENALFTDAGGLASAFGDIAQVLVESAGGSVSGGLALRWKR
jgi:molecular chaperone DnaK (HSP70)